MILQFLISIDAEVQANAASALQGFIQLDTAKTLIHILNIFVNILIRVDELPKVDVIRIFEALRVAINIFLDVYEKNNQLNIGKYNY